MNILEESSDHRAPVNYHELLGAITRTVGKHLDNLFSISQTQIIFDIDKVAYYIASKFPPSILLFEPRKENVFVSTHFADLAAKTAFTSDILRLQAQLRERFMKSIPADIQMQDLPAYIRRLFTSIDSFAQDSGTTPSLRYANLKKAFPLKKQRLHLRTVKTEIEPCLKGHKLTIHVERLKDFSAQITQGILAFLQTQDECDESDIAGVQKELERRKQKSTSDLNRLSEALIKHSLARLHRAAQLHYLRYLYKGMQEWHAPTQKASLPLLRELFNRLEKLEAYIGDSQKADTSFQVTYQGAAFNLREIFTRADAFDTLPIITNVEGLLGETSESEKGQKTFTFGLKLKLNGPVQVHGGHGEPVFDYYAALLNPNSGLYKQREQETATDARERQRFLEKVLKVALLYLFVFTRMDDAQFDPAPAADRLLGVLSENDDKQKTAALAQLYQDIRQSGTQHLDPLRDMLIAFLHNQKIGLPRHEEPLTLSLHREILASDLDSIVTRHHFFQEDWEGNDGRDVLRYVSVEGDSAGSDALCRLPVTLIFETTYFDLDQQPPDEFTMSYLTDKLLVLPLAITPFIKDDQPDPRHQPFLLSKNIILSYRQRDDALGTDVAKVFVYRFTYMLLAYLFLKMLLDESIPREQQRRVFLPVVCLHTKPEAVDTDRIDTEAFLHSFSKVLAHMLAEDFQASSQGLDLRTTVQGDRYKLPNALASLYNTLPRLFSASAVRTSSPPLEKLAIITVSSRRADLNRSSPHAASSTVYGDVVGMEVGADGSIHARILTTFSENAEATPMFEHPEIIIEQVRAYYQQGYRHFLYVAQAPYTSTLHLPSSDARTELYFMNESVIHAMRQVGEGTKVYPIFCDKYYVVKQRRSAKGTQGQEPDSLYIDDLGELSTLAVDKNKRSILFFNVFNGLTVSKKDDIDQRIYNGVVSYGTLVNMYEDTTYYQYIWQDLLGERAPGSLSTTILDFLTLLHFMRYEKNRPDRFKLDPYSRIIGNDSIGKCAIFPHVNGRTRFNSLGFLTLVRSVLQTQR
jgi:hypothetical protein